MILLDIIDALPVDDAAQAHAREWARQVRALMTRQDELIAKADALLAADQLDEFDKVLDEHERVSAELAKVCHRQMEFMSRLRIPVETMQ